MSRKPEVWFQQAGFRRRAIHPRGLQVWFAVVVLVALEGAVAVWLQPRYPAASRFGFFLPVLTLIAGFAHMARHTVRRPAP
jgi:hypothetical protein